MLHMRYSISTRTFEGEECIRTPQTKIPLYVEYVVGLSWPHGPPYIEGKGKEPSIVQKRKSQDIRWKDRIAGQLVLCNFIGN